MLMIIVMTKIKNELYIKQKTKKLGFERNQFLFLFDFNYL